MKKVTDNSGYFLINREGEVLSSYSWYAIELRHLPESLIRRLGLSSDAERARLAKGLIEDFAKELSIKTESDCENTLTINAFNLWVGAVFSVADHPGKRFTVSKIHERNADSEVVVLSAYEQSEVFSNETPHSIPMLIDYNTKVFVSGSVVDPSDYNNFDTGV